MKTRMLSLAALVLCAAVTLAHSEDTKEQAKFQGTWVVESTVIEGQEMPADVNKAFKMTFKGDTYVVVSGQDRREGTYRIDPAKQPKAIDIMPDDGTDRGRIQPGIYTFDGEKLKICAATPGKERPRNFETKDKMGYSVMILKKAK